MASLLRRLAVIIVAAAVLAGALRGVVGHAFTSVSNQPAWANPAAMALRKVSSVSAAQNEPTFLNNLDCSLLTYRLVADSNMRTGCFTEAAFGLVDPDSQTIIFSGTDEG